MTEQEHFKRIYSYLEQDMKFIIELQQALKAQADTIKELELEVQRLNGIVDTW